MEMPAIINSVISLFLIMLVGVYASKKGIINSAVGRKLTELLLDITLPCMVLSSFGQQYGYNVRMNIFKTFGYSFAVYIIVIIASSLLLLPVRSEKKAVLHFANVFTNTGYIGFPILNSIFGPEAVMYGSIYNIFFNIFLWTYGIMIYKGKAGRNELYKETLKALRNPSLIAVYVGLVMILLNFRLPEVMEKSVGLVGGITGPISMIIVGALANKVDIRKHLSDWTLYYGTASKLIAIPALLYTISIISGEKSIVASTVVILASMPAAAMTSIFADSFDVGRDYAAVYVVATTLLSVLTIPILLELIV